MLAPFRVYPLPSSEKRRLPKKSAQMIVAARFQHLEMRRNK